MILRKLIAVSLLLFALIGKQSNAQAQNQSGSLGKTQTISGIVTERNGPEIVGATVLIKSTVNGVMTDLDGKYSITAEIGNTIEVRMVGYNSVEFTVEKGKTIRNIEMYPSDVSLDEVVVVGYGQQKKGTVVSAINSVSASDIRMPTRSLTNSIAGRVAGVMAIQRSGEPGNDDAEFWIRGRSSFSGGTSPLVLVDGIPRSMSDVDVDEIETFSVLKDAAATAIYGAEGANGVILVTTKRGKVQKTTISGTAQYSIVSPDRMPKLMNSYDYLSLFNESQWNEAGNPMNFTPTYSDEILNAYKNKIDPDLYPDVNWLDLLSNSTYNQRYTLNMRGGGEKSKFFVSGAYYNESGIYKSNTMEAYDANIGLNRFNLRSNIDIILTPSTDLGIDMSGQYKNKSGTLTSADALFSALTLFPVHVIPMQYSDGNASDHPLAANDRYNPYNMLNYMGYQKSWEANIQTKISLKQKLEFITRGLSARGLISFDANYESTTLRGKRPKTYYYTNRDDDGHLAGGKVISEGSALSDPYAGGTAGKKNIYIEAGLDYANVFNRVHDVTALILYNQKESQSQTVMSSNNLTLLPYRKQSIVTRVTYAYDNRYILEASFGATGSENFSSGNRWGIFPAVGASWWVSEEKFFESIKTHVNKLRMRFSLGLTGNDNVGVSRRFPYREQLEDSGGSFNFGFIRQMRTFYHVMPIL